MIGSVTEYQEQMRAAQAAARKSFTDRGAEGSPGTGMPGGEIAAQDFTRPYQAEGHAAESPQSGPPCDFPVTEGQPQPAESDRKYLEGGIAPDSPANAGMPPQVVPPGLAVIHGSGPIAAQLAAHQGADALVMTTIPAHGAGQ